MKISFIVPAHNSARTISACLRAIHRLDLRGVTYDVTVVNNNSCDGTKALALEAGVAVVDCLEQGRSQARNFGAAHTASELIAFVDSDVILDPAWVQSLLPFFATSSIGAAHGAIIPVVRDGSLLDRYRYERKRQDTEARFIEMESSRLARPLIDSAAFLVRRSVFTLIGGFNETLPRAEDLEFSTRLIEHGFSVASTAAATCDKIDDRTLAQHLRRSFDVAYRSIAYQSQLAPEGRWLYLLSVLSPNFGHSFNDWRLVLIHGLQTAAYALGALAAILRPPAPVKTTGTWRPARLNRLLPPLGLDGRSFLLCTSKRFSLNDSNLIFFGFPRRGSLKVTDPEELRLFRAYLAGTLSDTSALARSLQAKNLLLEESA